MTRHDSSAGRRRRNQIAGQFTALLTEMMLSPAWRVLSLAARRVLDRVSIEVRHHGGHQANDVPVTYRDFEKYGIDHHSIAPAIREVEALGFLDIVRHGRGGNAEFRLPALYRATYECAVDCEPDHKWRRVKTVTEAKQLAANARKQKPRGETHPETAGGFPPRKRSVPRVGFPPYSPGAFSPLLLILGGQGGRGYSHLLPCLPVARPSLRRKPRARLTATTANVATVLPRVRLNDASTKLATAKLATAKLATAKLATAKAVTTKAATVQQQRSMEKGEDTT